MKTIIIGGVAGGATAATRLRRLQEDSEITVYERGNYVSFANCGLPYHIGGIINSRESLIIQTPENFEKTYKINVKTNHEVLSLNPNNKTIRIKNNLTEEIFDDNYDYLILSPGASPIKPPIPGIELENIFTLRTIPDMDKIIAAINKGAKSAVIIGGGFIGIELAENFIEKGIKVSLVEMMNQVLISSIDYDIAYYVHQELDSHGVKLYLNESVVGFSKNPQEGISVMLSSGKRIDSDFVVLSIGVRPEIKLAKEANLEIGETGGILVNEKLQTSNPFIYAIGDAVEVKNSVTKTATRIPLAGPANRQARIAANNIAGIASTYDGSQGTSIVKIFELTCASTGANTQLLSKLNIPFKTAIVHAYSHASYYPGAYQIHIKLLYSSEDGKLLGGQVVGYDGVDKRIDIIATAIKNSLSVFNLQNLELAYAPPYGSARDPINILGYIGANDLSGFAPIIDIKELENYSKNDVLILDVRTEEEFALGNIENSINIPLDTLRERYHELPKDKTIITCCKVGHRGYLAQRILIEKGFKVYNLTGGYDSYEAYHSHLLSTSEVNNINNKEVDKKMPNVSKIKINACGLQCPGPLLKLKEAISTASSEDIIEIEATDQGFYKDVQSYASSMNLEILNLEKGKVIKASLKKSNQPLDIMRASNNNQATIVVFSNDLDKVLAAFIIANGCLAMGKQVSMFFTFWGLNVLRKDQTVRVKKNLIEKMFGLMMPKGAKRLVLSKMHMLGMGTGMIKWLMKSYNVDSLDSLINSVVKNGGKLIACTMSMNLMGIKKEELIDGIEEGGVATYLGDAEKGGLNLFI